MALAAWNALMKFRPKRRGFLRFLVGSFLAISAARAEVPPRNTVSATPAEMRQEFVWFKQHLFNPKPELPFSFTYDGRSSSELLARWPAKTKHRWVDELRTQRTRTWTDQATSLQVRCVAVEYADYPVVEWTIYFKNLGTKTTPLLENIQGL